MCVVCTHILVYLGETKFILTSLGLFHVYSHVILSRFSCFRQKLTKKPNNLYMSTTETNNLENIMHHIKIKFTFPHACISVHMPDHPTGH